jgi:hypothetical protein
MRTRCAVLVAGVLVAVIPQWAQPAAKARAESRTWTPLRTADGDPDLEGTWTNSTIAPLERPAPLAGRPYINTEQTGDRREGGPEADVARSYNEFWRDRGTKVIESRRTSLIVDPPEGKVPRLTPAVEKRIADASEQTRLHSTDGPEYRSLWGRCLTRGLPMLPGPYNNDFQIVQTPGYEVILHEMIHDARVIRLDGRPHVRPRIRQWMGDGRGHWEGGSLVVDTTNLSDKDNFRGSAQNLDLSERFTQVAPDEISYEFMVDDPTTFTRPWTAQAPMSRAEGEIFEYGCQEGNYARADILRGARAEEAAKKGLK